MREDRHTDKPVFENMWSDRFEIFKKRVLTFVKTFKNAQQKFSSQSFEMSYLLTYLLTYFTE